MPDENKLLKLYMIDDSFIEDLKGYLKSTFNFVAFEDYISQKYPLDQNKIKRS